MLLESSEAPTSIHWMLRLVRKRRENAMATENGSGGAVAVPADVLEGLEAVRRSGAHMVERAHVLVLAKRMGYRQTVRPTRSTRTSTRVGSLMGSRPRRRKVSSW